MWLAMKSGSVIATGTLKQDAEIKQFDSGKVKASFSFRAANKKTEDGKWDSKWANCVVWGDLAPMAAQLKEGTPVLVTGELKTREFNHRKYEEVNVDFFAVCGGSVPTASVDDLAKNFPNTVTDAKPVFADVDDDEEASLPF